MTNTRPSILRNGTVLAGFGLAAAALLAVTWLLTSDLIFDQKRRHLLNQLEALLPADYDNDPLEDVIHVTDGEGLGSLQPVPFYRARQDGQVSAVMFSVIAPDGYSGPIKLLLGVKANGELLGVRALDHSETPGLGDIVDTKRSDWILQFNGRSLGNPAAEQWAVRRDGGAFDQVTGATVTARAATQAIARGLGVFAQHQQMLLTATAENQ